MTTGVVVGKFRPPHRGHKLLIDTAAASVDQLFVLVLGSSEHEAALPVATRAAWLRHIHPQPGITIIARVIDHAQSITDPDIIEFWNQAILRLTGQERIDILFTSERDSYGQVTAAGIGARHVMVDPDRVVWPVAGHQVVDDPFACWAMLEPIVRAHYAVRVRLVGGESSGKTTLADQLARSLRTAWVPEHGRTYSTPLDRRHHTWTTADFMAIARRQAELEDLAARRADRVLLCDTDAMVTAMWHEQYLDHRADELEAYADARRHYALTIVAGTDIPWVQDGDRRSVAARRAQQADLLDRLTKRGESYIVASGSVEERLDTAIVAIERATSVRPTNEGVAWARLGRAGRWRYLERRDHPWRRSLGVRDSALFAGDARDALNDLGTDYELGAARLGLTIPALREADWYAARHDELIDAERRVDTEEIAELAARPGASG